MSSENYENFSEILKYYKKLAEKFWNQKISRSAYNDQNSLLGVLINKHS